MFIVFPPNHPFYFAQQLWFAQIKIAQQVLALSGTAFMELGRYPAKKK